MRLCAGTRLLAEAAMHGGDLSPADFLPPMVSPARILQPKGDRMFKEFKEFALRGNVLDMAIGIILGVAFGRNTRGHQVLWVQVFAAPRG